MLCRYELYRYARFLRYVAGNVQLRFVEAFGLASYMRGHRFADSFSFLY